MQNLGFKALIDTKRQTLGGGAWYGVGSRSPIHLKDCTQQSCSLSGNPTLQFATARSDVRYHTIDR